MLRRHYPAMVVPELPNDTWQRHQILLELVKPGAVLVGSSLGGLSALLLARDVPERLTAMVLVAPAVGFHQETYCTPEILSVVTRLVIPAGLPCVVLAGTLDDVIPLVAIEALIDRSPNPAATVFHKLEEGHSLNSEKAHEILQRAVASIMKLKKDRHLL